MSWQDMIMATAVASADPHLGMAGDHVEITEADALHIRLMVRAQLEAFRKGRAIAAFALASPRMRDAFETPDGLMDAILDDHDLLADVVPLRFGPLLLTPSGVAQFVVLQDSAGDHHPALYLVERDVDDAWVSGGCLFLDGDVEERALAA